ncbi:MAG TPA: hypothetical protein VKT77_21640 [Chthonomonadaceae bacterium]|nr:hypothetical protein [Chthonomonadaceae bacterium]
MSCDLEPNGRWRAAAGGRLLLVPLLVAVCALAVAGQTVARVGPKTSSRYAFAPIHLPGRTRPVTVEVSAKADHDGDITYFTDIRAAMSVAATGRRTVLSSTPLPDIGAMYFSAKLIRHRPSGQYLLAVHSNGGQYDHEQVYYIDAHRMRPVPALAEMGVLQGDSHLLDRGILIEHTYAHYVFYTPHSHAPMHRTLRYRPMSHNFAAGRYHWDR